MTPELTNVIGGPVALNISSPDDRPVIVSRHALTRASLNMVTGAALLWVGSNRVEPLVGSVAHNVVMNVLLFAVIAAALPIQFLLVTRPLVKDVMGSSVAPLRWRLAASSAAWVGSVLTALAYYNAWRVMSAH